MRRVLRTTIFSVVVVSIQILASPILSHAQSAAEATKEDLAPPRLPALPETIGLLGSAKIINSVNAPQFKALIPLELYSLVREKKLELDSRPKLRFELTPQKKLGGGEDAPTEAVLEASSADELLQYVAARAIAPYLEGSYRSMVVQDRQLKREFSGEYVRLYPKLPKLEKGAAQLFRERLVVRAPLFLSGYTMLLLRFSDETEDLFYTYSPIISKTRQLTAALRGDGILHTPFSSDDLFTWSGNPRAVQPSAFSETVSLVPFVSAEVSPATALRERCAQITAQNTDREVASKDSARWNFASKRFPFAGGALLTQGVFTPRTLYRLELEPRDPYALYGRQLLYIDKETHLVVYKPVLDRKGRPWKFVWSILGGFSTDPKRAISPYVAATVVEDLVSKESQIFDFETLKMCGQLPSTLNLADFDPRKLEPQKEISPSPTISPSPKENLEPVDEVVPSGSVASVPNELPAILPSVFPSAAR